MAACCLYHLNWYKSQPLQDQDEMRPENRLMSAGCTAPKSASRLIDMTPVYTTLLSISPTVTQSTDLHHVKWLTTTIQDNQADLLASLSFFCD